MRLPSWLLLSLCLPACGGGGGGGTVVPVTTPVQLAAPPLDLGPGSTTAELAVALPQDVARPALLRVTIELPPELQFAASDRLVAAVPVPDLDGELQDGRLVVLCGDARNVQAAELPAGPLFRVRLATAVPRRTGTVAVRLVDLQATTADGTPLSVETAPTEVPVVIR